jgi:hypothetical protein
MKDNELAYLGWVLEQNQDKEFVQRILKPAESPVIRLDNGDIATHKMAWENYKGKYVVYPTIQREGRGLVEKSGDRAFEDAINSGEYVEFNTPGDAEWFSKNYKKVWDRK